MISGANEGGGEMRSIFLRKYTYKAVLLYSTISVLPHTAAQILGSTRNTPATERRGIKLHLWSLSKANKLNFLAHSIMKPSTNSYLAPTLLIHPSSISGAGSSILACSMMGDHMVGHGRREKRKQKPNLAPERGTGTGLILEVYPWCLLNSLKVIRYIALRNMFSYFNDLWPKRGGLEIYTLHSTLYTLHSTFYTLHSTLYTL